MRPRTARLAQLFDLVPRGTPCMIDVGTDHALLPLALVGAGRCARAIASDLRPGPLVGARLNVARAEFGEQVEVRLGPGLSTLGRGEAQVCVIAGMGFGTIATILEQHDPGALGIERVIVQTPKGGMRLRRWLWEVKGWRLEREILLYDHDRPYVTCVALPHEVPAVKFRDLPPLQQLAPLGMRTSTPEFFARYVAERVAKIDCTIQGLSQAKTKTAQEVESLLEERVHWLAMLAL